VSLPPGRRRNPIHFERLVRLHEQIELPTSGCPVHHSPSLVVEEDKDRSAPLTTLRSARRAPSASRGTSVIGRCRAQGSVIHSGSQTPRSIGLVDDEMHAAAMLQAAHHDNALTRTWVMRILDQDVKALFLGSISLVRLGSAKVGLPVLGHKACRDNRSGRRVPKLFAELPLPGGDGRARILRSLIGVQLLILDDRASSRSTPSV
jgi:hypothetical protein